MEKTSLQLRDEYRAEIFSGMAMEAIRKSIEDFLKADYMQVLSPDQNIDIALTLENQTPDVAQGTIKFTTKSTKK